MSSLASTIRSLIRWVVPAFVVYLVTRLSVIVGFAWAQGRQGLASTTTAFAERWDGWWYLYLSEFGYPDQLNLPDRPLYGPWGFFPTWSWTIRAVTRVTGFESVPVSLGLAAVFGTILIALVGVTANRLFDRRTALVAMGLFAAFPGSLALSMPYTEGLFLAATVAALLLASRSNWGWACVPAFVACATRSTGVALIAGLVVLAVPALVARSRDWRPLAPVLAGAAGFACCISYAYVRTGDAFIWRRAQAQWNQRLDFGEGLVRGVLVTVPARGPDYHFFAILGLSLVLFAVLVALAVPHWRSLPLHWYAYSAVTAGLVFAYSSVGPRPRMLLALIPLFVLSARTLQTRWWAAAVVLVVLAVLTAGYAYAVYFVPYHVTA